jgi:glycosyltransferase involved in cell wall biosynthesis
LESVKWANEIFVVDSFSTDQTLAIAKEYTSHIYQHKFENYARQKNWALDTLPISHEWFFIIDADEQVTPELRAEIESIINNPQETRAGFYVNRRFIFLGKWIKHCGWYPSWNLRLFRHGLARYEDRPVHEHMVVQGEVGYLQHDMIHKDYRTLHAFFDRHNKYSTLEAEARFRRWREQKKTGLNTSLLGDDVERKRYLRDIIWPKVPFKPLIFFLYMYILKRGFLDGKVGLLFSIFHAFQEFSVGMKLLEMQLKDRQ